MMPVGSVNAWRCPDCGKATVGVHVDEGVTPMFVACRATEGCAGRAVSVMYPEHLPESLGTVRWEWYKPSERWARRKGADMLSHVMQGGLVIRELTDAGRHVLGSAS